MKTPLPKDAETVKGTEAEAVTAPEFVPNTIMKLYTYMKGKKGNVGPEHVMLDTGTPREVETY